MTENGFYVIYASVRWAEHCSFDGTVRERAFDDLVAWMERCGTGG